MNRFFFICIFFLLCIQAKAQEKDWVDYPYREITVDCRHGFPYRELITSCFIQTRDEFNKLCSESKSELNFFREVVLGVHVATEYEPWNPNNNSIPGSIPIFRYSIMQDPKTGIIHCMFYHYHRPPSTQRALVLHWIAIQKPIYNYEINVHFINWDNSVIKKVYKNTQ